MSDDQPTTPTKVTITGKGVTVTVEAPNSLDAVRAAAREEYVAAYDRCHAELPKGFAGAM